ncbi:MAG: hypothetical protein WDA03_02610 [Trueperaceae bacterium]
MAVTTELVKQLRAMTGAGMMDVKRALDDTNGDLNKAAELLRERGIAKADKKADRAAKEASSARTSTTTARSPCWSR